MTTKELLHRHCMGLVEGKVKDIEQSIRQFQEAANEDSKSSMGDKYETNRAMMHLEKEKASAQLNQLLKMRQVLNNIKSDKQTDRVEIGSLVTTEKGKYFISIGLGPIDFEGERYLVISAASPIGQLMMGLKAEEEFSFRGASEKIVLVE